METAQPKNPEDQVSLRFVSGKVNPNTKKVPPFLVRWLGRETALEVGREMRISRAGAAKQVEISKERNHTSGASLLVVELSPAKAADELPSLEELQRTAALMGHTLVPAGKTDKPEAKDKAAARKALVEEAVALGIEGADKMSNGDLLVVVEKTMEEKKAAVAGGN